MQATATVNIDVLELPNIDPVANDDNFTVDEDSTPRIFGVVGNDTDANGDSLTIFSVGDPSDGGTVSSGNTTVTYEPADDFFGTETFTYAITDGNGGFDSATVTVTVDPVNDAPTAEDAIPKEIYAVLMFALASCCGPFIPFPRGEK